MSTMTVEQSHIDHIQSQRQNILDQLKEITGVEDVSLLEQALRASTTENGVDLSNAVNILVDENGVRYNQQASPAQNIAVQQQQQQQQPIQSGEDTKAKANKEAGGVIDLTNENSEKEDLQRAIALSLQEQQHGMLGGQVTAEEQDISRVLEQSLAEAKAGTKRKRGEVWQDPLNPHERKRQNDWPVGLKNVGNTCWFSAVIQSLFHLPVFRHLVLNFIPPELNCEGSTSYTVEHRNIVFMQELRRLFALLGASLRKYVDPLKAVDILKEAFQSGSSDSQQDVSEFTHKLLEWLEDAFKSDCSSSSSSPEQFKNHECNEKHQNPMLDLFYGQFRSEGHNEGRLFSNEETFGQYPLQVNGFSNIHESLEAATAQEIETSNQETITKSGQEHWFTKLPPVLLFELSRFQFNQQLGRPEKIHNKFDFPEIIYMDRYMEVNKNITRTKREEVRGLKERRDELQSRLEKYLNYGLGAKRVPLQDVLQYALDFVETKPPAKDSELSMQDVDMASPISNSSMNADSPSNSPVKNSLPELCGSSSSTQCVKPESLGGKGVAPAPKHVSEMELKVLQSCLKRWRTEVENDVRELQDSISVVDGAISEMYNEPSLQKVPYRLHAVLVHEGQAASGHYWAYVYNHVAKIWLKFNDITVSETCWEELQKESVGGYHNASAYCLMYIDCNKKELVHNSYGCELSNKTSGIESLPLDLRHLVLEDNKRFKKELEMWDQELSRKKEEAARQEVECQIVDEKQTNMHQSGQVASGKPPLYIEHSQYASNAAMQALLKVVEAVKMKGVDIAFSEACVLELKRVKAVQEDNDPTVDHRLMNFLLYVLSCHQIPEILQRVILVEEFAYLRPDKTCFSHLCQHAEKIVKSLKAKVEFLDVEKRYSQYHADFLRFREVTVFFLTGFEIYCQRRYQEALPYFLYAHNLNEKLCHSCRSTKAGLNPRLLKAYRRQCLLDLNDIAIDQFESDELEEALDRLQHIGNLITPCMNFLNAPDASVEDVAAGEEIRSKWCLKLGDEISGEKQLHLQEFLSKLLDPTSVGWKIPCNMKCNILSGLDLFQRFSKVMQTVREQGFYKLPLIVR